MDIQVKKYAHALIVILAFLSARSHCTRLNNAFRIEEGPTATYKDPTFVLETPTGTVFTETTSGVSCFPNNKQCTLLPWAAWRVHGRVPLPRPTHRDDPITLEGQCTSYGDSYVNLEITRGGVKHTCGLRNSTCQIDGSGDDVAITGVAQMTGSSFAPFSSSTSCSYYVLDTGSGVRTRVLDLTLRSNATSGNTPLGINVTPNVVNVIGTPSWTTTVTVHGAAYPGTIVIDSDSVVQVDLGAGMSNPGTSFETLIPGATEKPLVFTGSMTVNGTANIPGTRSTNLRLTYTVS